MPEIRQICVATYPDEMSAEVAKTSLEANGIPAFISKDDCGGMTPFLTVFTKIRLMIDSSHEAEATVILNVIATDTE